MKILITAFEPFDNNDINYSNEVINKIKDNDNLTKLLLPVEYFNSFSILKEQMKKEKYDHIILLGEARSYKNISYEVIGINELSNKEDNKGLIPNKKRIIEKGLDGIFSTLDYNTFSKAFNKYDIKINRSFSAGTYVCNSLLYQTLAFIKEENLMIKCGFIHLPILNNLELNIASKAFDYYINNLINNK